MKRHNKHRRPLHKRAQSHFPPQPRLILFCEGKVTEPNYFQALRNVYHIPNLQILTAVAPRLPLRNRSRQGAFCLLGHFSLARQKLQLTNSPNPDRAPNVQAPGRSPAPYPDADRPHLENPWSVWGPAPQPPPRTSAMESSLQY